LDLLWTSLLNSDWHDWRGSGRSEDRLEKDEWLTAFLSEWGIAAPVPPSPAERAALKAFRAFLRRLAEQLSGGVAPSPADLAELNRLLLAGPVARQVVPTDAGHRLDLLPMGQGWPQAIAEIAATFARTLAEGEAARVRICENPDCLWVFYDDTRNRTKRFCDEKACGNLLKVRRFRARQKGL
jgi:predicted RNA-binding Zn ribbon-like protein